MHKLNEFINWIGLSIYICTFLFFFLWICGAYTTPSLHRECGSITHTVLRHAKQGLHSVKQFRKINHNSTDLPRTFLFRMKFGNSLTCINYISSGKNAGANEKDIDIWQKIAFQHTGSSYLPYESPWLNDRLRNTLTSFKNYTLHLSWFCDRVRFLGVLGYLVVIKYHLLQ